MKIDWKKKLCSRKFWMAIASFVALVVIACGGSEESSVQITALIMAGATVVGYIFGEGLVDASFTDPSIQEEQKEDKNNG